MHALRRPLTLTLLVLTLVAGVWGSARVSTASSWGWDESMHAGLPAARISAELGELDPVAAAQVAVECQQYPFVVPVVWGALAAVTGQGADVEVFGRRLGRWVLALLALGAALLARELVRALFETHEEQGAGPPAKIDREEWCGALVAFALVLMSPLSVDYAGTWFLEVPFAALAVWSVWAWLRRVQLRGEPGAGRRDLVCGALLTAAFFTKFNYGLLLGFGAALALAWEALGVWIRPLRATWPREQSGAAFGASVLRLAAVPLVGFAWWFVLPLPGGLELGASHRDAFAAFLGGNQQLERTPDAQRLLHWGVYALSTPRLFVLLVAGLGGLTWCARRRAPVLAAWLVWLACLVPIATHNFHLDRFLVLPLALGIPLGVTGLVLLARLGARGRFRSGALWAVPVLVLLAAALPGLDGDAWFARTIGFADKDDVRTYQEGIVARYQDASFDRPLSTAGLEAVAADKLLDAVASEVLVGEGAPRAFGWLGISSELSPAALVLGVHARAAEGQVAPSIDTAAVTRPDGNPKMIMTFEGLDPGWNDDQLFAWADSFDVVFTTVPPDLRERRNREFVREYQTRLIGSGRVDTRELASVQVPQAFGPPKLVKLFALTPVAR